MSAGKKVSNAVYTCMCMCVRSDKNERYSPAYSRDCKRPLTVIFAFCLFFSLFQNFSVLGGGGGGGDIAKTAI